MSWWTIATIAEVVWIVSMALGIVLQRRSPVATIAWILVLAWLPLLGIAVYFLFGPRRLRRRQLKRAAGQKLLEHAVRGMQEASEHPLSRAQLATLCVAAGEAPPLRADEVTLYFDGAPCFAAIHEAIARASHHVHVEYYIFDADETGTALRDLLARRAKEGIEVRLLVDWIGAYTTKAAFFQPIVDAGGQVAWFNPVVGRRLRARTANFRTHRKIVVVDGCVGFTGGMNVSDDETSAVKQERAWRDTHLRVEGSAVRALQRVFLEDWYFATETPPPIGEPYLATPARKGEHLVQFVASGPDQSTFAIHKLHFAAITEARERVWLETPYFVPDEPLMEALVSAALRGVDVRLIVPAKSDNVLVDLAARSYFPELLRVGVKIFEHEDRFLHAKTAVIDGDFAIVGSANLDNRSFRLNFEIVAALYGEETNRTLAAAFEKDLATSRPVKNRELRRAPFFSRLAEAIARLSSPLL
jgi:cardiolipin synthase